MNISEAARMPTAMACRNPTVAATARMSSTMAKSRGGSLRRSTQSQVWRRSNARKAMTAAKTPMGSSDR